MLLNVIIVGIGQGGRSLLPILIEDPEIKILAVAGRRLDSPGLVYAKELGIEVSDDFEALVSKHRKDVDVIIDATGVKAVDEQLRAIKLPETEIISGLSAKLMWDMVEERKKREEDLSTLYNIGLTLTSAKDVDETLRMIVEGTCRLVGVPAASLALFNDRSKEFELRIAVGFSENFKDTRKWKIRKGALTDHIISNPFPTIIKDVTKDKRFDNPVLLSEGVRSLIAIPLKAHDVKLGILYADDFKVRDFSNRDVSILSLLASQAAIALEKAKLLEQTQELAITDGLTALYNHRYFHERMEAELARAARYDRPLSLILIDVDHFKSYNDNNGHPAGDVLLRRVAETIRSCSRQSDIVARYGGEEFAVLLPETGTQAAFNSAERIRKKLASLKFPGEDKQPLGRVTLSAGVATYPTHASTKEDLLKKADALLYLAKENGRNQVKLI